MPWKLYVKHWLNLSKRDIVNNGHFFISPQRSKQVAFLEEEGQDSIKPSSAFIFNLNYHLGIYQVPSTNPSPFTPHHFKFTSRLLPASTCSLYSWCCQNVCTYWDFATWCGLTDFTTLWTAFSVFYTMLYIFLVDVVKLPLLSYAFSTCHWDLFAEIYKLTFQVSVWQELCMSTLNNIRLEWRTEFNTAVMSWTKYAYISNL